MVCNQEPYGLRRLRSSFVTKACLKGPAYHMLWLKVCNYTLDSLCQFLQQHLHRWFNPKCQSSSLSPYVPRRPIPPVWKSESIPQNKGHPCFFVIVFRFPRPSNHNLLQPQRQRWTFPDCAEGSLHILSRGSVEVLASARTVHLVAGSPSGPANQPPRQICKIA